MTRAVSKKAKMESQSDGTGVQSDSDVDGIVSGTVYNNWCKSMAVGYPTSVPSVTSDTIKSADLKLPSCRGELIKAQNIRPGADRVV